MDVQTCWQEEEKRLRREAATGPELDEQIVNLVVAMRLLGFPTVSSCFGHLAREHDAYSPPWVSVAYPMASRFEVESLGEPLDAGDPPSRDPGGADRCDRSSRHTGHG